jgi:branched-chain amino acid transport system ATP-binding protein
LLAGRGLVKRYGGLVALADHDIAVGAGEIVGVIGPNGSGKSTLFNVLTGFTRADAGTLTVDGRDVLGAPPAHLVRLGVARTFQHTRLFRALTVLDNVQAAAALRHPAHGPLAWCGWPAARRAIAAQRRLARERLALVGLADLASRRAGELPYGDQRRVEIARALATGPRVLLLDEPAAGLDAAETAALGDVIDRVRTTLGIAVVLVEHDMTLVMRVCDRLQVLAQGRCIAQGTPDAVRADPQVREVYLGHG